MDFATKIKRLRRERDMTQEQLAEALSISPQAISRWETGAAMPDISLLPIICNMFGVTSDYLLGIDISKKKEEIQKIRDEASAYSDRGYTEKAIELLENGLARFPESFEIMQDLIYACKRSGEDEKVIAIGEKILAECTVDHIRHSAIQLLCMLYPQKGKAERAKELAESMPWMCISRDFLSVYVLSGTAQYRAWQRKNFDLLQFLERDIAAPYQKLDSGENAYTSEELALLRDKSIALIELLFEKGDYGFYFVHLAERHRDQARFYAKNVDTEKTLFHLNAAADCALGFLKAIEAKEYSSLLFRGMNFGVFTTDSTANSAKVIFDVMNNEEIFDFVRYTEQFKAILEKLKPQAQNWEIK